MVLSVEAGPADPPDWFVGLRPELARGEDDVELVIQTALEEAAADWGGPDWEWTERTCLVDWEMSFHCFREILTCAEPASHRLFCHYL